jgi:hypothetical protein
VRRGFYCLLYCGSFGNLASIDHARDVLHFITFVLHALSHAFHNTPRLRELERGAAYLVLFRIPFIVVPVFFVPRALYLFCFPFFFAHVYATGALKTGLSYNSC